MDLTKTAERTLRRVAKRPDLPGWWPLLTVILGVFFVVYLFWHLISPSPKAVSLGAKLAAPGTYGVPSTPSTGTPGPAGPTSSIPSITGGPSVVPVAAVSVAKSAALAFYTTDFSAVPLSPGAQLPTLSQSWPGAAVTAVEVQSTSPTTDVFRITVDPAPGSPSDPGPHYLSITVSLSAGKWGFSSGG
jgi:hypothetical protein